MKGKNTITLNQHTMCEALQVWLDKTLAQPNAAKVTAVKSNSKSSNYGGDEFEVEITSDEPKA